jgi:hypothetical protein
MVWLNGKYVGASKDSRLPAEFDVTHMLLPWTPPHTAEGAPSEASRATNVLAIQVIGVLQTPIIWGSHGGCMRLLSAQEALAASFAATHLCHTNVGGQTANVRLFPARNLL